MDHRIPKAGVVVGVVCAALAALTFVFLNLSFEGPSVIRALGGEGYRLTAEFDDTEVLPTKQPVMQRGLTVGKVKSVEFEQAESTATVEVSIDEEYAPVYRDASVAIGERTVLGDPFVKLDPGTPAAGFAEPGDEIAAVDSVDFDEALDFLDAEGRAHVKSTLDELRVATRDDEGAQQVNATVGGLTRTVAELRLLTDALEGQEDALTGIASDGATILRELGTRERALRAIVSEGRTTLDALAANDQALEAGLAEAPGVLAGARDALAAARPLLVEVAPLIDELRRAAPALSSVLADLPGTVADTVEVTGGLTGLPTLRELLKIVNLVGPSVPGIEASARNLVPLLRNSARNADGIAAFFANLRAATQSGDADGKWLRTAAVLDPFLGLDVPSQGCPQVGMCFNAYPKPGDALNPQPYEPGSYRRTEPFDPPPPPGPGER